MNEAVKGLLVVLLTLGATLAGYSFFSIRVDSLFGAPVVTKQLDPLLSAESLPVEDGGHTLNEIIGVVDEAREDQRQRELQQPVESEETRIVKNVQESVRLSGSQLIESKYYSDFSACDIAVRHVAAEYKRRGIRPEDIAETAPFPDSRGVVVILNNRGVMYYFGCFAPPTASWAVYVQYKPIAQR